MESIFALRNKRVLVTGACGTVGSRLVRQLLAGTVDGPEEVIGIDNNEGQLFFIDQQYLCEPRARFFLVDIRDRDELTRRMRGAQIVFHAAALKHVVLTERSPVQAIETNILGLQNVISAATECGVERVIFTSSDKAVNPTSVMGTSKLMGERLMTAANSSKRGSGPVFTSTRFGNVLGSSGSVIPIFHNQIAKGGPVTLTHRDMTRFVMTIDEAVGLVINSCQLAQGGEVFVTKMPVMRISDLALAMISELAPRYGFAAESISMTEVGTKPGEKLYEELMSHEETRRAVELESYFCVLPAFRGIYQDIPYNYEGIVSTEIATPYVSSRGLSLTVDEIKLLLIENGLLTLPQDRSEQRYWPGDKAIR